MNTSWDNEKLTIELEGRIDSGNASDVESEINEAMTDKDPSAVVLDAERLEYISSAGLRVILRLRKKHPDLSVINVKSDVFEVFEMTGFTEMMKVEKAYRKVSVEGCEEIGRGANGSIYRIDKDNVVKVYNNPDALDDIQHEREVARLALILGIPTAISYDVVKIGDSYGSVFELLNAKSFSSILAKEPEKFDWCVDEYVEMLKRIHSTEVPAGKLPDMRETVISWANFMQDYLPEEAGKKLLALVEAVPHDDHMIHGDYHTKNLELQDDEVLLIDMDTLAVGNPVFELGSMFNAYRGFFELDHDGVVAFQGFSYETAQKFWYQTLAKYLGTDDESVIRSVEDKARIIGYTRLIRRAIRRGGLEDKDRKAEIDLWTKELIELLEKTDTLLIDNDLDNSGSNRDLDIEAVEDNLNKVMAFVDENLEAVGCSMKAQMQIDIAVEEVFVNICKYAYHPDKGRAVVRVAVSDEPVQVRITFIDHGKPYDPLLKDDPDVTLSAAEREIGGLGIFMVKQTMDAVEYEYKDGSNILTLVKNL
ncbi:MAG: anti-sigma factor antagonist [Mogibacterium sp.]|nr:anti-sigma factor antagonist [Mogibacterium sp.]